MNNNIRPTIGAGIEEDLIPNEGVYPRLDETEEKED